MQIYSSGINSSSQSYPLATVTGSRWASGAIQATEKLSCCCITSVVSDSVQPHRQQPTRLPLPWDSPGKNTEVGCRFLLQCMKVKMKVKSLSRVLLLVTPWTAAHQAPLSMGLSRQEYWSGCHCLLREKLRDLGNLSYSSERTSNVSLLFPVWTWGIKHTALGVVSRPWRRVKWKMKPPWTQGEGTKPEPLSYHCAAQSGCSWQLAFRRTCCFEPMNHLTI